MKNLRCTTACEEVVPQRVGSALEPLALYAAELVLFYCANLAHSYVRSQSAQKEAEDMSKTNLTYFLYGAIDVTDLAWMSIGLVMKQLGFSPISSQGVVRSSR